MIAIHKTSTSIQVSFTAWYLAEPAPLFYYRWIPRWAWEHINL